MTSLIQVVEVNVKVEKPGPNNPHNNAFFAEETLLRTEQEAQRDCNALSARHWIVSRISPVFLVHPYILSPIRCLFVTYFLI